MSKKFLICASTLSFLFLTFCGPRPDKKGLNDQTLHTSIYISPRSDSNFFSILNLNFPGMEKVKKYVDKGDFNQAKYEYLTFRREKSKVKWNINPKERPIKPPKTTYPQADRVINHIVDAVDGAPETYLGEDINWEFNPVDPSEPHFTNEWTYGILNRMPHWDILGDAYWQTSDEKFAREWVAQMVDWYEDNPVPINAGHTGMLTWRTIEAGIRMSGSWMNAYYYFLNSPSFTPDAHTAFTKSVIEHGQRLRKISVEHPERSGNWITMESNGLGTVGILFPELILADDFRRTAFDRMNIELDRQVYPDGAQVELTPGYHQVSRSNFMELVSLAQMNSVPVPDGFLEKLKKMYEFNLKIMDPEGMAPPFNDAERSDITYTLKEAYKIWKDQEFLFGSTLGKEGKKPEYDSYFFNYAGYYIMRSGWRHNDNCLYFDAGPVGTGHQHEDMLNIYLYSKGRILLTEPGTYSYDHSKWRKYVLSTQAHNTITVDGKEQHRTDIPECRLISEPLKNPWFTSPVLDYGAGTYSSGYQNVKYLKTLYMPREFVGEKDTSVTHTRHVIYLKPFYYVVVDFLEGKGEHLCEAFFHLNAEDALIDPENLSVNSLGNDSVHLSLFPLDKRDLKAKIVKGQEEPVLGWLPTEGKPIPTVVYSIKNLVPLTFSNLVYPYTGEKPEVTSQQLLQNRKDLWAYNITTPNEKITLMIRKKYDPEVTVNMESPGLQSFSSNAKLVVLRNAINSKSKYSVFYQISRYKDNLITFDLGVAGSLIMLKENNSGIFIYNPSDIEMKLDFSSPVKGLYKILPHKWLSITSAEIKELPDQETESFFGWLNQ